MAFNASFGEAVWCLGNVLRSIMSPWVTAGMKSGYEGREGLSFASHSSAAPDFHAFEGMGMKVFPLGCAKRAEASSGSGCGSVASPK